MYKNYIFGFGRTLADLTRGYRLAYSQAFRSFGIPYEPSKEDEYFSTPVYDLFSKYRTGCACVFRDFMTQLITVYDRNVMQTSSVYPDVSPCVRKLYAGGCRMGIVTDSYEQHVHQILAEFGLDRMIPSVVGIDRMAVERPHPYSVSLCMRELGGSEGDTVLVSSDPMDILTGGNAGIDTVLLDRNGATVPGSCSPTHVIGSLLELPGI